MNTEVKNIQIGNLDTISLQDALEYDNGISPAEAGLALIKALSMEQCLVMFKYQDKYGFEALPWYASYEFEDFEFIMRVTWEGSEE